MMDSNRANVKNQVARKMEVVCALLPLAAGGAPGRQVSQQTFSRTSGKIGSVHLGAEHRSGR
jgi:hypothetical protein